MTATDTIPENPTQLADMLGSGEFRADLMQDPAKMGKFIGDYAAAFAKKDTEFSKEFAEMAQQELRNYYKENGYSPAESKRNAHDLQQRNASSAIDKGQFYNAAAPGAKLDEFFEGNVTKRMGDYFRAGWKKYDRFEDSGKLATMREKMLKVQNSYGSTVPSDGGFLIPEVLRSQILMLALENSIVRPRATVIPMDSLKVPIPAVDETSRVSSIYGGIIAYWTEEGAPLKDSSAKFGQVTLDAKKLTAYAAIPNELFADAPAFGGFFNNTFPAAIGWFEDIAFLTGDGTDKPLGVLNGAGLVSVTRGTSSLIQYTDIVNMYSRLLPQSLDNSVWVCSHDAFPQLAELSFTPSGGTTPVPVMLWQMNAVGTPVPTLMGRPLIRSEKVGPLGSAGDIGLFDFGQYLVGDRQSMSADSSSDYLFGNDKTAFRIIERVDGRPWIQTPLTPHNGSSSTLSPYVVLHA